MGVVDKVCLILYEGGSFSSRDLQPLDLTLSVGVEWLLFTKLTMTPPLAPEYAEVAPLTQEFSVTPVKLTREQLLAAKVDTAAVLATTTAYLAGQCQAMLKMPEEGPTSVDFKKRRLHGAPVIIAGFENSAGLVGFDAHHPTTQCVVEQEAELDVVSAHPSLVANAPWSYLCSSSLGLKGDLVQLIVACTPVELTPVESATTSWR